MDLSGEFQPNIFLDFGRGKIFSNRWAHGNIPYDTMGWKKTEGEKPLYVYAENEDGSVYNTGIECPSTLMCVDPNGGRNIKVDIFNGVCLSDYDMVLLSKYNLRFEYLEQKEEWTDEEAEEYYRLYKEIFLFDWDSDTGFLHPKPGINYYTKEPSSVDDLLRYQASGDNSDLKWEKAVVIRPQAICMPQLRPVVQIFTEEDGGEVSFGEVTKVEEGDTYTITILPNPFKLLCQDEISNTVLFFSDKRRLMVESYLGKLPNEHPDRTFDSFRPDKRINYIDDNGYKVDNVDNYYGRFKIGNEFADLILLHTGTMITVKAEYGSVEIDGVEQEVVYWNVENHNSFKKSPLDIYDFGISFEAGYGGLGVSDGGSNGGVKMEIYCSKVYESSSLDVNDDRSPIRIKMNTTDNCFENAFYLQDNDWW